MMDFVRLYGFAHPVHHVTWRMDIVLDANKFNFARFFAARCPFSAKSFEMTFPAMEHRGKKMNPARTFPLIIVLLKHYSHFLQRTSLIFCLVSMEVAPAAYAREGCITKRLHAGERNGTDKAVTIFFLSCCRTFKFSGCPQIWDKRRKSFPIS